MGNRDLWKRTVAWILAVLIGWQMIPTTALAEEDWIEPIPESWPEESETWEEGLTLLSEELCYPVTVDAEPGGTLEADCEEAPAGQWVGLKVTADTGYELEQVTLNGERLTPDENGQYGFFQPEMEALAWASFLPCTYWITNLHPGFQPGAEQATYGEMVTLTPMTDREILELEITAEEQPVEWEEAEGVYRFWQPGADVTIRGTYAQKYQTFFDAATGEDDTVFLSGGTVTRDKWYHLPGQTVTITAEPEEGMGLRQLDALAGSLLEVTQTEDGYTFLQPKQDVKITATFERLYTVGNIPQGVTVSRECAFAGETVDFTVRPPLGKTVKTVEIRDEDGQNYPVSKTESGYSFRQPERDVEILVTYDPIFYQIRNDHTGIQLSAKQAIYGETIGITPIAGQFVDTLLVETAQGEPVALEEGEDGWFFCQPAADVVVTGTARKMYRATFATLKNGSGELEEAYHLPGEKVRFRLIPEEGFDVASMKVTGTSGMVEVQETGMEYVFVQPEEDVKITATFARWYQVTVSDERVCVSAETPLAGEKVTIAVTPRIGEAVSKVSVQGADGTKSRVTNVDGVYTYTQPERDVEVIVTFAQISYQIRNAHDGVTVSTKKACYGDKVLLTPLDRYVDTLEVVTADGTGLRVEQEEGVYFFYQPAADVTVTGSSRQMYQTAFLSMKNGTATLDAVYHLPGETVTVYPAPEGDYEVSAITVTADGMDVPVTATEEGFTFRQPEAKAKVKLTFARRYSVFVEETWDGTIEISTTDPFPKETVELRIRPYTGKSISKVTVQTPEGKSCRVTRSGSAYRFTMPESDVTVRVVFKRSNGSAKTGEDPWILLAEGSMLLSAAGLLLMAQKRKRFFR